MSRFILLEGRTVQRGNLDGRPRIVVWDEHRHLTEEFPTRDALKIAAVRHYDPEWIPMPEYLCLRRWVSIARVFELRIRKLC